MTNGNGSPVLVADLMRQQMFSIGPDTTVLEAARIIMTRNVQNVIVVEGGRLAGVLGWQDILTAVIPSSAHLLMQADHVPDLEALVAMSSEHTHTPAREVMRTAVLTTGPSTPATRALALMLAGHVPVLPVVDAGRRLVGVVTLRELLSAFFFPETPRAAGHS
jgi:CBS domain-containing protein